MRVASPYCDEAANRSAFQKKGQEASNLMSLIIFLLMHLQCQRLPFLYITSASNLHVLTLPDCNKHVCLQLLVTSPGRADRHINAVAQASAPFPGSRTDLSSVSPSLQPHQKVQSLHASGRMPLPRSNPIH
jgi:hypothetical protein